MSVKLLRSGTQATISDPDGRGGLSVAVSQAGKDSTAKWRLSVRATTDEGTFPVGAIVVCPPANGSQAARVVAIANCPGARDWSVFADLVAGGADGAQLSLAVGLPGNQPGLARIAERYSYHAGDDGALVIPVGETVLRWTAVGAAGGGTVTIDGGDTIEVPEDISISGEPAGTLAGPITFVFTGTASYYVEVALSA